MELDFNYSSVAGIVAAAEQADFPSPACVEPAGAADGAE